MTTPIAVARTMGEGTPVRIVLRGTSGLQPALREAAELRRISRAKLDELSGLAEGHSSKILAPIPTKAIGPETEPKIMRGLAVRLVLEDDPERLLQIRDSLNGRAENYVRAGVASMKLKTLSYVNKVAARVVKRDRRAWAKKARREQITTTSPEHRKRIATTAAQARWRKQRKAKKEAAVLSRALDAAAGRAVKPPLGGPSA